MPPEIRFIASGAILLSALYHFSDLQSKSADGYFIGFPAIWNIVIFYLLVFRPDASTAALIIFALAGLTFVPMHWLHPVRAIRFKGLNITLAILWFLAAVITLWKEFDPGPATKIVLALTAVYFIANSMMRSFNLGPFSK